LGVRRRRVRDLHQPAAAARIPGRGALTPIFSPRPRFGGEGGKTLGATMNVDIILVGVNPKMVAAWRTTFENNPEVQVVHGSILEAPASAWVSPTNSRGQMDGGLDAILKGHFGGKIEKRLQQEIARLYNGVLPVGHATCVETCSAVPRYLISTPTMM